MNFKGLAVVVSCMYCLSVPVQANAAEKEMTAVNAVSTGEVEPLAAGLISVYSLGCTKGTKTVYITATTAANDGIRFKAAGNITSKSSDGLRLTYNADTAGGDSGGPVFVNESFVGTINNFNVSYDCNTVIAIHTHSGNSGVRINFDIMQFCYQNSNLTAT